MRVLHSLKQRMAQRVVLVDVLSALFGMGAWLSINSLYTQLPLLIDDAPEGWMLSSYIVILCQAANVGLIFYDLIQRFFRNKVSDDFLIFLLLTIGTVSLFLMAFVYSRITEIEGSRHSLALLILVFTCALVACTSSVLFIPYMNRFRETYLVSYMIGEGLSGLIPSIISLLQGVGGNPICVPTNSSDPHSPLEKLKEPPNFSVTVYLIIMSSLQAVSLVSFLLLKILPVCQKERVSEDLLRSSSLKNNNEDASSATEVTFESQSRNISDKNIDQENEISHTSLRGSPIPDELQPSKLDTRAIGLLLSLQTLLSFIANGLFPSIQPYSCRPYGNVAYHLAISLGAIANPLACYLLFFLTLASLRVLSLLSTLWFVLAVYIFITATMSPTPPLVGTLNGEVLVVIIWILITGLISFSKLAIATRFRKNGGKGLFWYGTVTQIGAAAGAVVGFVLLTYTHIFHEYSKC